MRNFWDVHGVFFLIFITFFPRLTMLFAVKAPFGALAWLGWLFFPHLTAAILATEYYWQRNPVLCTIAWIVALAGTGGEIKLGQKAAETQQFQSKQIEQVYLPVSEKGIETVS